MHELADRIDKQPCAIANQSAVLQRGVAEAHPAKGFHRINVDAGQLNGRLGHPGMILGPRVPADAIKGGWAARVRILGRRSTHTNERRSPPDPQLDIDR